MGTEELEAQIKAASEKVVSLKGEKAEKAAIDAAVTSTPTQSNQYILHNVGSCLYKSDALVSLPLL